MTLKLAITLRSDTTPGRGDGVAGLVDAEIEYDPVTGLPRLGGRTLKGLLVEECSALLFAIRSASPSASAPLANAAAFLFGSPGSGMIEGAALHVGTALLPDDLRAAVLAEIRDGRLTPAQVLESLASIRRQTAVDPRSGAPATGSLRSSRVLVRGLVLFARLDFLAPPDDLALALLAASCLCLRRLGMGRNRGRGRVSTRVLDDDHDRTWDLTQPLRTLLRGGTLP
ncbi:MAG: RAMP superfamily CRISPR-associated protein [Candidatus Dormibacteraceae bacterium]